MMATLKINDADFNQLVALMERKYGINLKQKRTLIEGRLNSTVQQRGFTDFTKFLNMVYADKTGTEMVNLLNKLTTNHTFFYRESEHYDFLRTVAFPELEKRKTDRRISMWSAACSSGEEPYTNTMQMAEYFGSKPVAWNYSVLATDISMRVLQIAKEAKYAAESMRNLEQSWKNKYFKSLGNDVFEVVPEIRKKVTFQTFNLMDKIPFRTYPFDIIFCRNVMIYFETATKIELVNRLYDALAPGGYLMVGHAESIPRDATPFKYVKPATYRKELK